MDPNSKNKGLYNKLGPEELKKRLENEDFERTTVSFYKYVIIDNPQELRNQLYAKWDQLNCLGRIYIAEEGINAQMSVPNHNWEEFEAFLRSFYIFNDIPFKIALSVAYSKI